MKACVTQSWSEPLVLFCFALSVYAIVRGAHWAFSGAALGLLELVPGPVAAEHRRRRVQRESCCDRREDVPPVERP